MKISAHEIWTANGEVAVNVDSKCVYRVTFFESEAHILAPGLNITVELDKEVYPIEEEEFELAAIMLIAQVEGGMEL